MEASEWTDEMGITRELHRRFSSAEQIEEMADKERQKLIQSLMRKGYGYGDITHVMRYFGEIDQERVQDWDFFHGIDFYKNDGR